MSLSRFIRKKFGTLTRSLIDPVTPTVLTTLTQILLNNPDRLAYTIVNMTANNLFVGWDRGVAVDRGIFIAPNGGSLQMSAEEDGELVGYELFGISETGNSTIYTVVTEGE